MPEWGYAVIGAAAMIGGMLWFRNHSRHQIAASRVPTYDEGARVRTIIVSDLEPIWWKLIPWVFGIAAFILAYFFLPLGLVFDASLGVLFFVVGYLIRTSILAGRTVKVEAQLAEAIDHVVTSLHAGIGVLDALGGAEADTHTPLKPHLTQFLLRLRLGDDPPAVCREMAQLLPLESFRLFYYTLAVQWEGGGNLAPTLATTGRFIRDRVELGRRVRAQTTEARFSVLAILGLTYFLAALMWNLDPSRVEGFLGTRLGEIFASGAIVLQALGAAWIARISQIRI